MSEETQVQTTTTADPAIEARARAMGWKPKEEWVGDTSGWRDAAEYVRRGEEYLPIVRSENRKLTEQVGSLQSQNQQLQEQLKATTDSVEALKQFNREQAAMELKKERRELRAQLIEARKEGDVEKELQIQEQLDELDDRTQQATKTTTTAANGNGGGDNGSSGAAGGDPTQRPEFQQFMRENPWFEQDPVMRAASLAIMQKAAAEGKLEGMSPAQRFSFVSAETKKAFKMDDPALTHSKVEGTTGPAGGGGGRTYNDLPADAKAACDRFEKRMVGEGRAFKTSAEWRKHYVQNYDWS